MLPGEALAVGAEVTRLSSRSSGVLPLPQAIKKSTAIAWCIREGRIAHDWAAWNKRPTEIGGAFNLGGAIKN